MRTIHKYNLSQGQTFKLPVGSKLLHIAMQAGSICAWFEVDAVGETTEKRSFVIVGTGHMVPEGTSHVGTVLDGIFVWHIYEDKP